MLLLCFIFETEKESRFIYSTVVLNCKNTAYFSCVVFLSITVMHMTDASPFLFVFNRVLDTLIGVGIALIVNTVHLPRKRQKDIFLFPELMTPFSIRKIRCPHTAGSN